MGGGTNVKQSAADKFEEPILSQSWCSDVRQSHFLVLYPHRRVAPHRLARDNSRITTPPPPPISDINPQIVRFVKSNKFLLYNLSIRIYIRTRFISPPSSAKNFNNKITCQLRLVKYNSKVGSNKTKFYA